MERERGTKIIAVVALVVAIAGVSLGFAAFANNLTITPNAEVKPLNSLSVLFSSSNTTQEAIDSNVSIVKLPANEDATYTDFTATTPRISNAVATAPTLENLKATFVRPGEKVTYTLYVHNESSYDAQLTAVAFGNKTCTAKTGTNQDLVDRACGEIDISVIVGGGSGEPTAVTKTQNTSSDSTVSGHVLAAGEYETLKVTLSYNDLSSGTGNTNVNGDFDVAFGNVTLTYSSAN